MTALKNIGKSVTGVFHRRGKDGKSTEDENGLNTMVELEDDVDASEFEDDENEVVKKPKSRRPKETKFTQQKIASFNPVLTPKKVLPIYFFLGALFLIFGGVMLNNARHVDEIFVFYQDCDTNAPTDDFADVPDDHYKYIFHKAYNKDDLPVPQWKYVPDSDPDPEELQTGTCQLRYSTPYSLEGPLYIYYYIENFFGNHRRYVLSFSEFQIIGDKATLGQVKDNIGINCKPLVRDSAGKIYYPCGLIANAMFNDTFPDTMQVISEDSGDQVDTIELSNKNINWSTDKDRYKKTKYSPSEVVPPPYWKKQFPDGYNDTNMPDIHEWEEFQNWMRTPAFSKFSRLIRRSANSLPQGQYQLDIDLHWPVTIYNGKKAAYITHGSTLGGRNTAPGIIYLVGGSICFILALISLASHLFWGRSTADTHLLSWNK
ncbi:Lem3p [Kluyveromyces lactis]|uniref:KLLA0E02179p n=1 Tax=Kluyveromyces lactis (strain ATCC 8585 / CBS 2359 / DSM 70799 / NBRC 1267 / NRRL Y-1140 / WM37) TaxID=284590 RepID=Q6CPU3_KLULA|nr:uncharacterized protein KLLA0_E02179g [Kluyveromyces lactis]CAG99133.1 KLLA0E02179p [Kluyveromyces lactis]|eukprot:XP_454046.1 uncharacterized protein KLLA0_E02179g [Kluyveromyces lactis]